MSALLDQFVEEAGDLLDAAGAALLLLERNPEDQRAINDLFRSIHTLKGTSALFEFPALTKLVHAGEDVLDGVREGTIAVSPDVVDVQLAMLDLLRQWIDTVRATELLPDDASTLSRELIERLSSSKAIGPAGDVEASRDTTVREAVCDWLDAVPEADRMAAFRAAFDTRLDVMALTYQPDTDCYFRGEDPLLTWRSVPELLAFGIEQVASEKSLEEFDPYQCHFRFHALSTAPQAELEHLFRYVRDQVLIVEVAPERLAVPVGAAEIGAAALDFAERCGAWIDEGRLPEMRTAALILLQSIDPSGRSASAVRWLLTVSESAADRLELLFQLARIAGGQIGPGVLLPGDLGAPLVSGSEVADCIVAEQRRILALRADDDEIFAGRIASVGRTLQNIASAHGAFDAAEILETATSLALQTGDIRALSAAVDTCFGVARGAVPAMPAESASGTGRAQGLSELRDPRHSRMLKVDQAKIDRLMALIGELVVAKNALPFLARRAEHVHGSREMSREIGQRYSVIDRLAQEMQEAIMEVRLLPVSEVFARFPRLIRDIARKLDKQIELVLEGEETQADKNIIELLSDPLIHIVRNAADHGIETPEVRTAKGKPAFGTIRLKAMQEGDLVVIEVSDDGRGVDTGAVIAKALDRGLIDPEQAERMTPAEAANLIFHPGLSTADVVSDLSGRGVGMDVVKTSIRDAGGTVSVASHAGVGTTVRLAMPLSMAVMRVMTIETAGTLYGVPIDLIAETVRVDSSAIREIKQSEAFLLRDAIIPIVRLRRMLHVPAQLQEREAVLVLRTAAGLVGMIVDRFDEHMDIILKPLEGILIGLKGFAGTALLGDGRVLMVLDVKELL